jgi:hypothetical protein
MNKKTTPQMKIKRSTKILEDKTRNSRHQDEAQTKGHKENTFRKH